MWIRTIFFEVGVRKLTSPFTHGYFQRQEIDRILPYRIPAEGIPEGIAGGAILARVFPSMVQEMQDEDCGFIEEHVQTVHIFS